MAGLNLKLVQLSVEFMIQHLKPKDRLSIISFGKNVQTNFALSNMDEVGKKSAIAAVRAISASGSTNLSGGLLRGLSILSKRKRFVALASWC